jgi:hypothetical protein
MEGTAMWSASISISIRQRVLLRTLHQAKRPGSKSLPGRFARGDRWDQPRQRGCARIAF